MSFSEVLTFCKDVFSGLYGVAERVIEISTTPLSSLISTGAFPEWVNDAIEYWLSKFGISNITIMGLMLGSALIVFIVYTLIKWVVSLIP